ncbi:MAG: VIT and vWA domain-containing protein, partial [Planctomycetota bacterium]
MASFRTLAPLLVPFLASLLVPLTAPSAPCQGLHIGPQAPQPAHTQPQTRPHTRPVRPHPIIRPHRRPWSVPVTIKSLAVKTNIVDGVATTELHQVFHNGGPRIAEGTWILPLPQGATADHFTMSMNGKQVAGEVLDAGRARQIYMSIVRRQKDPGLLEYMGNGCLRARVFPIPAKSDMTVQVRYRQVLPETAGLHEWSFPLRAAHVQNRPPQKISMDVRIKSRVAIKNVYSPTGNVDVLRKGEHEARVSLELSGGKMPERDLSVFYGLSTQEFGINLMTWRKQDQPGYFMLMLAPKRDWAEQKGMAKIIHFVLDTSGSMQGKKIEQARGALKFFLSSLKPHDYFNVIPFSTEARPFFENPVEAGRGNIDKALSMVREVEARGGTNIEDGLTRALGSELPKVDGKTLVPITVFLTDGLPTVGTTDMKQLLSTVKKHNNGRYRVFVFGVGSDVNTRLLDKIAEQSRGDRDYVREHESIEVKTGALFAKVSHPVMTDVNLSCDGIEGFDMFPRRTPDLFKGSRLLIVGRFKGSGNHAIRLAGKVNGEKRQFTFEATFPKASQDHDFIPTLWAQRKVAVLVDAIRLNGAKPELVNEVRRLGKEFGIVTPYTSHLIMEEGLTVAQARVPDFHRRRAQGGAGGRAARFGQGDDGLRVLEELKRAGAVRAEASEEELDAADKKADGEANRARQKLKSAPSAPATGGVAVGDSLNLRSLGKSGRAYDRSGALGILSRRIKDRNFHLVEGVWIDSRFKPEMRGTARKIKAFSD